MTQLWNPLLLPTSRSFSEELRKEQHKIWGPGRCIEIYLNMNYDCLTEKGERVSLFIGHGCD